jgi:hypothetical protein
MSPERLDDLPCGLSWELGRPDRARRREPFGSERCILCVVRLRHSALTCFAVATVALAVALPAPSKDGVKATLTTRVPVAAPAGTMLRVSWTLSYRDEHGRQHRFGGGGIFVRLLSRSNAPAQTALDRGTTGRYVATVRVPKGGMRGIQIGMPSWSSGPNGTHRADWLFPITNNPFRR